MKKLARSFGYAFKGIRLYIGSGGNVNIHLFATVLVLALSYWLCITKTQWCLIVISIITVHTAEALNTSIEHFVNLISPQYHEQAGKIKDIAAGAVLIAAIGAAITGFAVLGPPLMEKLF